MLLFNFSSHGPALVEIKQQASAIFSVFIMLILTLSLQACSDKNDKVVTSSIGTTPSNGASRVSILIVPKAVFDGPVLVSGAQNGRLKLTNSLGDEIAGNIAYDDTNFSLSFIPIVPLAYGETYTLSWSGLLDRSGKPTLGSQSFKFSTFANPPTSTHVYSSGVISTYQLHSTDAKGQVTRTVNYDAVDAITGYSEHTFDADNNLLASTVYSDAGTDAQWFTPDDTEQSYINNTYDTNSNLTNHLEVSGGTVTEHYDIIYDANKLKTRQISYADLEKAAISSYSDYIYDAIRGENITSIIQYSAGLDGIINDGAGDDSITSYQYFTYNSSNLVSRKTLFSGPGFCPPDPPPDPDPCPGSETTVWYLDGQKDIVSTYSLYQYSGNQITLVTNFSDDGDGVANDLKDTVTSYTKNTYNEAGELVQFHTANGVGANNIIDEPVYVDDPITVFETYSTDLFGFRSQTLIHVGPGPDSDWFLVVDNDIGSFLNFNYDADGNRINFDTWSTGADLIVGTTDDELLEDNIFDPTQ